ncbi:Uncharacterised protein [Vibrio cholerae]|nr:Uncharacterised protein [Vibrio cholerae]CSI53793.1 Uncharacterised protein [Vibrio cholerae]
MDKASRKSPRQATKLRMSEQSQVELALAYEW